MLPKLNKQSLPIGQKGFSQILLPLFLLAAIGLTVYLIQQRTNVIPFADTVPTPPNGCVKVTLSDSNRYVAFKNSDEDSIEPKKSSGPELERFGQDSKFDGKKGEELRAKEFKDVVYKFTAGGKEWQYVIRKGWGIPDLEKEKNAEDSYRKVRDWDQYYKCENLGYDANNNVCLTKSPGEMSEYGGNYDPSAPVPRNGIFPLATMSHLDRVTQEKWVKDPNGKKFQQRGTGDDKQVVGAGSFVPSTYDNGRIVIYTSFVTGGSGHDDAGVPNEIGTSNAASYYGPTFPAIKQTVTDQIFAFVPEDPDNANIKCTTGSTNNNTTNLLDAGASCGRDDQCKSGDCAAGKCVGGTKTSGSSCTKAGDCSSGSCTNGKCDSTGSKVGGNGCTNGSECQSGSCTNNKCVGGSTSSGKACNGNSDCASNKCTNNQCVAVSPSPSPSGSGSPAPSGSASASPSGSSSPAGSSAPAPSTIAGTVPISLTKAEITGFKSSFDALSQRLPASPSGNLRIVSTLATTELTSIVSELSSCPDDANVGTCIDSKFRTRFDLAKTAARLSAFYAVFNDIPGICVKADLGLNPLFTAASANNTTGRVNLCNARAVPQKIWMIFAGGTFTPIQATDPKFKPGPTCATLPTDVITHYRNAETLFKNQPGFVENTFCDGKTSVAGGNDGP